MSYQVIVYGMFGLCILLSTSTQASPFGNPVREYGGAIPLAERRWFTADDYPATALRKKIQGRVVAAFTINVDGKITKCGVESSSGSSILDSVPCKLLQRRARFKPLLGKDATPVEANGRYSIDFWLPDFRTR